MSRVPHLAGTEESLKTAEYVRDRWIEQGLDSAKLVPYNVLLSYPNPNLPNKVSLCDKRILSRWAWKDTFFNVHESDFESYLSKSV